MQIGLPVGPQRMPERERPLRIGVDGDGAVAGLVRSAARCAVSVLLPAPPLRDVIVMMFMAHCPRKDKSLLLRADCQFVNYAGNHVGNKSLAFAYNR